MSDPNASLLALFDPIQNSNVTDTTPTRPSTMTSGDALTMSSFFNRLNTQPNPHQHPTNNRGSLIDFSFNLEDAKNGLLGGTTPTKKHSRLPHSTQLDVENKVPPRPAARTSPRKHAPPSPSKRLRNLDAPADISRPRRSSLDASTVSLDLKHRLASADMSFDILRDDVSFLTNMAEEVESSEGTPSASQRVIPVQM